MIMYLSYRFFDYLINYKPDNQTQVQRTTGLLNTGTKVVPTSFQILFRIQGFDENLCELFVDFLLRGQLSKSYF